MSCLGQEKDKKVRNHLIYTISFYITIRKWKKLKTELLDIRNHYEQEDYYKPVKVHKLENTKYIKNIKNDLKKSDSWKIHEW